MHAAPPDGSEWWSWDPDERNFESSRCSLADEHRNFALLDRTAEVTDARSESDRGTAPAAVLDGVFEGAAFRQDVLSVLLDVRRHQCTLIDNVDRLLVKWGTDGTLSDSSNWKQPKASDRTLSDSSNWKQPKASDQKRSTTQADRGNPVVVRIPQFFTAGALPFSRLDKWKRGRRTCSSSTKKRRTAIRRDQRCPPTSWNASSAGACRS